MLLEPVYEKMLSFNHLQIFTKNRVTIAADVRMISGQIAQMFLSDAKTALRTEQVDLMIQSTKGLEQGIHKIPEKNIRNELLAVTKKPDGSLHEIKRLDQEIGSVRQLVGATKEIQDWKLLISDVDRLKGEHVPREVFDAKVNELNTRINSLSEIKIEYDKLLAQQNEFMKQQAEVMKQQSGFITWIKYATILVPIAVILVPIIDALIRYFAGIS